MKRAGTRDDSTALTVSLPRELAVYTRTPQRWRSGCGVEVLRDGEAAFPAMIAAIEAATKSVLFATYILVADATGNRFKDALVARAKAGVAARVMYDAVGSFGLPESFIQELRVAGVEVVSFNPIALWRQRYRLSHRDHRKILVVDDAVAFTGGINISDDYAAASEGGGGWHDMHCRVTGPVVLDIARMFRRTWHRIGGPKFPPISPARSGTPNGDAFTRLLDNTRLRQRGVVRRAYLHVIRSARKSILIENAYFLPDRALRRALTRAARRGVDVRIIVPGHNDVRMVGWASLYVCRRLTRLGVQVLRWRGPMMHAKMATIDAAWSTIGSYNFDAQSRFSNLELTVEMLHPPTAHTLVNVFESNVPNCDPFTEDVWKALPVWIKVLAFICFRLRRFL
ncbi:N/A [soil metagenome]